MASCGVHAFFLHTLLLSYPATMVGGPSFFSSVLPGKLSLAVSTTTTTHAGPLHPPGQQATAPGRTEGGWVGQAFSAQSKHPVTSTAALLGLQEQVPQWLTDPSYSLSYVCPLLALLNASA